MKDSIKMETVLFVFAILSIGYLLTNETGITGFAISEGAVVDDEIIEALEKDDSVRVIVKLKAKEDIQKNQDKVLSALASDNLLKIKDEVGALTGHDEFFELSHKYETINSLAGTTTRAALEV